MKIINIILVCLISVSIYSIELPVTHQKTCTVVSQSFEPMKVEINLPIIPNHVEGQKFAITILKFSDREIIMEEYMDHNSTYRKNLKLAPNKLYFICVEIQTARTIPNELYVGYRATQDFQSLIGKIEIPPQLQSQKNLREIYTIATSISKINQQLTQYQNKQSELEDSLTTVNLHKNYRIVTLTLIQCLVIVLSEIYQIFALRRFLIQKNIY